MSETSQLALDRLDAPTWRARVYAFIAAEPATCDEVEQRLCARHQTVSARIYELAKDGAIVDTGDRRLTTSGRYAAVWAAATQPRQQLTLPIKERDDAND